ncbi:efflux RND transporter periplasmic adaptor subunit [Seohaeicola saemankumensis]|uniref:Efflux RND transporter periplasmic adaptor subunit n=1 Tax=Seohaeicola saemankumensis TaxID=481181 RepID=A0ABW3TA45_9RHOB
MKAQVFALVGFLASASLLQAESLIVTPQPVTDWKAVYAQIEAQTRLPARARLGGTLVSLDAVEGDRVEAGQVLARVVDDKLDLRLRAIDAQLQSLQSQLDNAKAELERGEALLQRGVTTVQRLDALRTQVDVLNGQLDATRAERSVIVQQAAEGDVLAPIAGLVLTVPVAAGAVVMPGEAVATIGGGGFFLRLAIPERHARALREGDEIRIDGADDGATGRLARIYPQIENGRVIADVAVEGLAEAFVDARVLVRLAVGQRSALLVPETAVTTRAGLDFVTVEGAQQGERAVMLGQRHEQGNVVLREILSGLAEGETVVLK